MPKYSAFDVKLKDVGLLPWLRHKKFQFEGKIHFKIEDFIWWSRCRKIKKAMSKIGDVQILMASLQSYYQNIGEDQDIIDEYVDVIIDCGELNNKLNKILKGDDLDQWMI